MELYFSKLEWINLNDVSFDELTELIEENNIDTLYIEDWESSTTVEIAEELNLLEVGYISIEELENLYEVIDELEGKDSDMILAYINAVGIIDDITNVINEANNAYYGNFDSKEEFGKNYAQETTTVPEEFEIYINWDDYADDLLTDFLEANGYYFLPI